MSTLIRTIFILLIVPQCALSQVGKDIFSDIYAYQFNRAESGLHNLVGDSCISENEVKILKLNFYWWQHLSGNKPESYLDSCMQVYTNFAPEKELNDKDKAFQLAIVHSYAIRVLGLKKQYLKVVSTLNTAMNSFRYALEHKQSHDGLNLISGMYNYLVDSRLEKHKFLYPYLLFYPSGNKKKGLELLQQCSRSKNIIIKTEAMYFLMKMNAEIEKDTEKASFYAKQLIQLYPMNSVFHFEYYKILVSENKINEAEAELKKINTNLLHNEYINEQQRQHFRLLINRRLMVGK